jgi:hypothetical protein
MKKVVIEKFGVSITECGIVTNLTTGNILKATPDKHGYPRVTLKLPSGKRTGAFIHRLIAMAFIPNPHGKRWVNHKDGNKGNFSIDNLEWSSPGENMQHAWDTGLKKKGKQIRLDLRDKAIKDLVQIGYKYHEIGSIFGFASENVTRIMQDKVNKKLLQEKQSIGAY